MKECKNYYERNENSPILMENISEQSKIHEYEKRNIELDLEKSSFVKIINTLR